VTAGDLLWVVPPRPLSPIVVVGGLAAAATTGALVAIGQRIGGVGVLFASISAMPFHRIATMTTHPVLAGLVVHAAAIFLWSMLCIQLARALARPALAAAIVAATQFTLSWIIARSSGTGLASVLALGDRVVYAVVLAGALVVGMRFALPNREVHDRVLL
jgi:hypothetical protein